MSDTTRLTVLLSYADADVLSSALRSEGIAPFTKMTDLAAATWEVPGTGGPVEVWVNVDDLDRARKVLSQSG